MSEWFINPFITLWYAVPVLLEEVMLQDCILLPLFQQPTPKNIIFLKTREEEWFHSLSSRYYWSLLGACYKVGNTE